MKLQEVYNLLAPKLAFLGDIVIAGGAVRDDLLGRKPKDFDLFILGPSSERIAFPDKFREFCELELCLEVFDHNLEWHKSEPFLLTSIRLDAETEVQVMHRELKDTDALLDTFDWNVSQFAYGVNGYTKRMEIEDIAPGKFLQLKNIFYPWSTLRRGYRFSERFQMRLHNSDIKDLAKAILNSPPVVVDTRAIAGINV